MNYFLFIVACLIVMIPAFYLTREKFRKKEENVVEVSSEELAKVEEPVKKLNLEKLVEKNKKVYVLYKGLPYCAESYYQFTITTDNRIHLYPVDWSGNYYNAEKGFGFLENIEKDLTLFTPLKEVCREVIEEESSQVKVVYKVSAKIRSKFNKTYKVEYDVDVNFRYGLSSLSLQNLTKTISEQETNNLGFSLREDPASDFVILENLRVLHGISLMREDVKEIEFKKFERPAKNKKTIITYG